MLNKKQLPENFDWKAYLDLNPDIRKAGINTESMSKAHWLIYGYKENRQFTKQPISLKPKNFDPKAYRLLNPNLSHLDNNQLIQHYLSNKENIANESLGTYILPQNFDPRLYKLYNKDLANLSNTEATKHYIMHGVREARVYFCGISYETLVQDKHNPITNISTESVVLINHDISKTGAPIFLYDLYDFIIENNIFKNVYILEPFPNKVLSDKPNKLYHYNDTNIVKDILSSINPSLIYSNSINIYFLNFDQFQYWHNKTILHFHETYDAISPILQSITSDISHIPTYVVSEEIKNNYKEHSLFKHIGVFPPFINESKQKNILKLYKEQPPNLFSIDTSKITIGMCGSIGDRKNILLFLRLAETYPEYNFLWVGGQDLNKIKSMLDPNNHYSITENFYWVPDTSNPYAYFKYFDYFFLTSKEDPCPIVVLENLLLNNKIIVIKDNIKTKHKTNILENYIEIDSDTEEEIVSSFGQLVLDKIPNDTQNNSRYISNFYSKPALFEINRFNNQQRNTNFIISSMFLDKDILSTNSVDNQINLINQFILRHSESYNFIPIIILSSNYHDVYGDKIHKYLKKSILNIDKGFIFAKNNYGYDISGLIGGLKIIYEYFLSGTDERSYLVYLHNKTNVSWKNVLNNILYTNILEPYDYIVSKKFFVDYNKKQDINQKIFENYPNIFPMLENQDFKYIQGTIFITRLYYLRQLKDSYADMEKLYTNIDKDDKYWQEIMMNNSIFQKYYIEYQNDIFNSPIDWQSGYIVKKYGVKNFIELATKYGLKGIPDGQFEHALERYIGYLISLQSPHLLLV